MTEWITTTGQQKPLRILSALLEANAVPHALLFAGIEGVGKLEVARQFAMACNCWGDPAADDTDLARGQNGLGKPKRGYPNTLPPCGVCRSCKKIRSGNHPDVIHIKPSGTFIRIEQIRTLCHTLALKPYEARVRVAIISEAQRLNPAAGNALLKILEEPPDQTVFILTGVSPTELLPTIVSRCQQIRFNPLPTDNLAQLLLESDSINGEQAKILAAMSNGSRAQAMRFHQQGWLARRNWLLDRLEEIATRSLALNAQLALAHRLSRNKEDLKIYLSIIYTWLRDLIVARHAPDRIIQEDRRDQILRTSPKIETARIPAIAAIVESAAQRLQSNASARLLAEALIMRIAAIRGAGRSIGNIYEKSNRHSV